jgi:PAS domain S-box-containing protein
MGSPADSHPTAERDRAIAEQLPGAVVFAGRDGTIEVWNRGAETLFGYPAAEALGKSLDLIIPERFRSAHWEGFRRAVASGETRYAGRMLTTRSVTRDGAKIYVDLSFALVKDSSGAVIGVLALALDATARHLGAR